MYEVHLSMSLLGFGIETMLTNFVLGYVGAKISFQHAREECESKRWF